MRNVTPRAASPWALPSWTAGLVAGCQVAWPGGMLSPGSPASGSHPVPDASASPFEYFRIVRAGSLDVREPITGMPGAAVKLAVIQTFPDGVRLPLPAGASVSWGGAPTLTARDALDLTPLATGSTLVSLAAGPDAGAGTGAGDAAAPAAVWVRNPGRSDHRTDLVGLLFLQDTPAHGTASVAVTCEIAGQFPTATARAVVSIVPGPAGERSRGQALYEKLCASCHGPAGRGSPLTPDFRAYQMGHYRSLFPAPALVGESAPASAALLGLMVLGDLGQNGRSLRSPMPNWLGIPNPDTGKLLGAAEFADLTAYLRALPR